MLAMWRRMLSTGMLLTALTGALEQGAWGHYQVRRGLPILCQLSGASVFCQLSGVSCSGFAWVCLRPSHADLSASAFQPRVPLCGLWPVRCVHGRETRLPLCWTCLCDACSWSRESEQHPPLN
jgi:hypothetical protein